MTSRPIHAKDMYCYAVYCASHVINRTYSALLKPLGLTYPQYITLTLLWERDGQRVGDLSTQLRMDSGTLTPLLKRLEAKGLIHRKRGAQDERQVFIHLTEAGDALRASAPEITDCVIAASGQSTDDLTALVAQLTKLTDALAKEAVT